MKKIVIIITILVSTLNAFSQRFWGVDYVIIAPQQPKSSKYNLEGISLTMTELNTDLSYGWYLDKEQEKTALLLTGGYYNMHIYSSIDDSKNKTIKTEVPKYIYDFPSIHTLYTSLMFSQAVFKNYEVVASYSPRLTSDFREPIKNEDFNHVSFVYIQKKFEGFTFGLGGGVYIIGDKITPIPLASFTYEGNKGSLTFLAPLSLNAAYYATEKFHITANSGLDFDGFKTNTQKSETPSVINYPDYAETTDFYFNIGIDHNFYNKAFWSIGLGYNYRELNFKANNNSVDKLKLEDGISISASIYSIF